MNLEDRKARKSRGAVWPRVGVEAVHEKRDSLVLTNAIVRMEQIPPRITHQAEPLLVKLNQRRRG